MEKIERDLSTLSIAVLIPCYNEAATVRKVIRDFRSALPSADIYVFDNNSNDETVAYALAEGAIIHHEPRQGKGYVVQRMFSEVDADLYILVDGDDTYPAEEVLRVIEPIALHGFDMVVASRLSNHQEGAFRIFHSFGNNLICALINILFDSQMKDVLSGYRCFSNKFVKTAPLLSSGFEIETELTLQALDKGFAVHEIEVPYRCRPTGSESKLDTWKDGFIIIQTILRLLKDYRPMLFFGTLSIIGIMIGLGSGLVVVKEFMATGLIKHFPLAIFAVGSVVSGLIAAACGFILDTVNQRMKELWMLEAKHILSRSQTIMQVNHQVK